MDAEAGRVNPKVKPASHSRSGGIPPPSTLRLPAPERASRSANFSHVPEIGSADVRR
jgi:hypothetical protein